MINKITLKRFASLAALAAAFILTSGHFFEASAQRDPFEKPGFMRPKKAVVPTGKTNADGTPVNYGPPDAAARIEYYKRIRDEAARNGQPLPKPTSVMTLNELAVTGIFKTPRGYAAMVEAMPIKLSYTIYPGEKFFDGQLVAVEENQLVFRRVTKVGNGKFVSSVENKPLKKYSTKSQIEGTAPADRPVQSASAAEPPAPKKDSKAPSNPFLSPLDEMNNQPATPEPTDKSKKAPKKPVKVANTKKPAN